MKGMFLGKTKGSFMGGDGKAVNYHKVHYAIPGDPGRGDSGLIPDSIGCSAEVFGSLPDKPGTSIDLEIGNRAGKAKLLGVSKVAA